LEDEPKGPLSNGYWAEFSKTPPIHPGCNDDETRVSHYIASASDAMNVKPDEATEDAKILDPADPLSKVLRLDSCLLEDETANAKTVAPTNGIFCIRMFQNWHTAGQWQEYKPGQKKWKFDRIADVIDPTGIAAALMVHEADVCMVVTGLQARIRLPAYPDAEFTGTITEIGGIGRDRFDVAPRGYEKSKTSITVFNAMISIEGNGYEFRPGMSADVEIIVQPPAPRLVVPLQAVNCVDPEGQEEPVTYTVRRKNKRGITDVPIKGRPYNLRYFLVEEGLQDGDTVLMPDLEGGA